MARCCGINSPLAFLWRNGDAEVAGLIRVMIFSLQRQAR
jgi:hypothetical protein